MGAHYPSYVAVIGCHEGRPLRLLLWAIAISAVALSVLQSLELKSAAEALSAAAGVVFPGVLLCGLLATLSIRGQAARPFVPVALLAFSAVVAISALLNGQIGQVTWLIAFGLLYLPVLTVAIWRTSATRESIRDTVRRISLSIVWMSLAMLSLIFLMPWGIYPAAGSCRESIFGLPASHHTPMGCLHGGDRRLPHDAVQAEVLVPTPSRLRRSSLPRGGAHPNGWIVGRGCWLLYRLGKKSRMVRMINTAIIGTPIVMFLWPTIASSFEESSLGSDVTTLNSRTIVWRLVADNWTEHPLLGWGAFTFDNATGSPLSLLFFNNSHNQFLEALIEGGAVGFMLMAGVALVLAWSVLTTRDAPYVAVAIMTLFFMMTEVPFTLHNYGFNFSVVLGALLLAILVPGPVEHAMPDTVTPQRPAREDATLKRLENALASQRRAGTRAAASPGPLR